MPLSIASGLGALQAIQSVLAGAPVTIGGIGLSKLEVPAKIPFGGEQMLSERKLAGGGRVIQSLGRDDRDIEWSGYFTGYGAVERARSIDSLRIAGQSVPLTWSDFRRQVVIKSFEPEYGDNGSVIPYRICCVVVTVGDTASSPSLLSVVANDLGSALGAPVLGTTVQSAITAAQIALPVATALIPGSSTFTGLSGAVTAASTAASLAQTAAGSTLGGLSSAAAAGGTSFGGSAGLLAASAAQDALASAGQAAAFVGRAAKNLIS